MSAPPLWKVTKKALSLALSLTHLLEPVRPEAVLPDRALCLPTFSHFFIVNKSSLSLCTRGPWIFVSSRLTTVWPPRTPRPRRCAAPLASASGASDKQLWQEGQR
jgi:hypothetical protein